MAAVITNIPVGMGFLAGQPLIPQTVPFMFPNLQAWAMAPATSIQDGTGGTNPITFSVDGGAAQNVNVMSAAGTANPTFNFQLNAGNTGGAGGARVGHNVAITVLDNFGNPTTVNLTFLRSN